MKNAKRSVMYGPFPGCKDDVGLDGHVSGLLMPVDVGGQHGVSLAVCAGIIPTASRVQWRSQHRAALLASHDRRPCLLDRTAAVAGRGGRVGL